MTNAVRVSCWPCDLASHFPAHVAAAAVLAAVVFAIAGRIGSVVVPASVAVWNLLALNGFWATAFEQIHADFPFRRLEPRGGHYGIGLMSRLPLSVRDDKPAGVQTIVATISRPQVTIVGTHTFPPFTPQALERRNQQFAQIAAFIREQRQPVVLVGDLNSSSWSPAFGDLLRAGGLVDTRVGRGVQATWPAWLPVAQVPIDHALVSRGVRVHSRFVGRHVGSDHLPVVLDFSLDEP